MKTFVYKILCFAVCLPLVAFCLLSSCGKKAGAVSEEEKAALVSEAVLLLEKSAAVNRLALGDGIRAREKGGLESGGYTEADADSAAAYGVSCTADIKALFRTVYTESTATWLEGRVLVSSRNGETGAVISPARYYDAEVEGKSFFMVKTGYTPLLTGNVTYKDISYGTSDKESLTVYATVCVEKDGVEQRAEHVAFTLYFTEAGLRLETFTGMTFDEGKK